MGAWLTQIAAMIHGMNANGYIQEIAGSRKLKPKEAKAPPKKNNAVSPRLRQ